MPARFENDDPNNQFCTPEEYFQNQYAQIFDLVANELDRRFNQKSFEVLREIENIVIDSSNSKPVEPSANFQTIYSSDLHLQDLKIQLLMLPDFLNTVIKENNLGIKKITSISTLCQVFNTCYFGKTMLNQVHKLLQIYLTIPMTTATAGRTFSTLRRLKNYLRTTMTQKRLNHVVYYIHTNNVLM